MRFGMCIEKVLAIHLQLMKSAMKNNTVYCTTNESTRHALEFLTIFGISILFTFAGMSYIKMDVKKPGLENKMEIPYVLNGQAEMPTIGFEKVAESFIEFLP